ncbi:MAG: hypothetical protein CM1200mP26_29880 [Acidimicrobiales bacterium]|nr:MAG: hypothetical protein CM1200mP26_29880 [Acidimicrobiales bacterium]
MVFRVAFKPTATIASSQDTVTVDNVARPSRHAVGTTLRPAPGVPMVEAMALVVLADHWLRQRAVDVLPK